MRSADATMRFFLVTVMALQVPFGIAASLAPSVAVDIDLLGQRRLSTIVGAATSATSVASWSVNISVWALVKLKGRRRLGSLGSDGRWPDVYYTTGCDAEKASWPSQKHWQRLVTLAAAWHGGFKNAAQWTKNATLQEGIALAMDSWFADDFTNPACLDFGGDSECPCGTPGLWNTNW